MTTDLLGILVVYTESLGGSESSPAVYAFCSIAVLSNDMKTQIALFIYLIPSYQRQITMDQNPLPTQGVMWPLTSAIAVEKKRLMY